MISLSQALLAPLRALRRRLPSADRQFPLLVYVAIGLGVLASWLWFFESMGRWVRSWSHVPGIGRPFEHARGADRPASRGLHP